MAVHTAEHRLSTRGDADILDVTGGAGRRGRRERCHRGPGERLRPRLDRGDHDDGARAGGVADLRELLERLIPTAATTSTTASTTTPTRTPTSAPRSSAASEVVPVVGGRLALGTWQQLVLIDFDDRPRERTVIFQVVS